MPFFLSPIFLWFACAAAIPVVLHLLRHRSTHRYPFSTLRFLRQAEQHTRRSRRITQCLAMLLRILLVLLIVFAFTRPVFRTSHFLPGTHRTLLLVMDCTASMQGKCGDKTSFESAKAFGEKILEGLSAEDRVALLAVGADEELAVYPPLADKALIRRSLQALAVTSRTGDLADVLQRAREREPDAFRQAEVHFLTDGAFTAEKATPFLPQQVVNFLQEHQTLFFWDVPAGRARDNLGVTGMTAVPRVLFPEGDGMLSVKLEGEAMPDSRMSVALWSSRGGVPMASAASEAGSGWRYLSYSVPQSERAEEFSGWTELPMDSYALDNRWYFSQPTASEVPVLLVCGGSLQDGYYLKRALQPFAGRGGMVAPEEITWDRFLSADLEKYAMVFLCDPPSSGGALAAGQLQWLRQRGRTVVVFPGNNGDFEAAFSLLYPEESAVGCVAHPAHEPEQLMVDAGRVSPFGRELAGMYPGPWRFFSRRHLTFAAEQGWQTVLEIPGQGAFVLRNRSARLWLFGSSAGREWSDLPLSPFYLVLMQCLVRNVLEEELTAPLTAIAGKAVELSWPGTERTLDVVRRDATGTERRETCRRRIPLEKFLLTPSEHPGLEHWTVNGRSFFLAVNLPEEERGISIVPDDELRKRSSGVGGAVCHRPEDIREFLEKHQAGKSLWPLAFAAAFLLLCLDAWFANWRTPAQIGGKTAAPGGNS